MTPDERKNELVTAVHDWAAVYGFGQVDPAVIVAQSRHETGGWSSDLIERANNAFGMMQPQRRATFSTGATTGGFASYDSVTDSVRDYFLRQRVFNIPDTPDDSAYMAATVASGYAEDPDYLDKWAANLAAVQGEGLPPVSQTVPRVMAYLPWWVVGIVAASLLIPKKRKRRSR